MKTSPVSFGSIMVFTLNDGKPKASVPDLVRTTFLNNPDLGDYVLLKEKKYTENPVDGSKYNSTLKFSQYLDKTYKQILPKGSNQVILTEVDFFVNSKDTEKRYFITAATDEDETKIHKTLSKGITMFAAKFGYKQ